MNRSAFLAELKRRRVFRVAAVYAAVAYVHGGLGDHDRTLDLLEQAVARWELGDVWIRVIVADPVFEPVRSDPSYTRILRRMGLQP